MKSPVLVPQADKQFVSAFSLFSPSVDALKFNIGTLLALIFAPLIALIPLAVIVLTFFILTWSNGSSFGTNSAADIVLITLGAALYIAFIAFCIILSAGVVATALQSAAGKKFSFQQAFAIGRHFGWRYFGLQLLVSLLVIAGLVLLIVPGVFLYKRYFLSAYYLIDHNLKITEAMHQSAADAKRFSGAIWGILGVSVLIGLVGMVPIIGGLISLVLSVMYICAPAVRYLEIKRAKSHDQPVASAEAPQAAT